MRVNWNSGEIVAAGSSLSFPVVDNNITMAVKLSLVELGLLCGKEIEGNSHGERENVEIAGIRTTGQGVAH
jgi:hypothetical protein